MVYKAYRSYCLAGTGDFPAEAVPVSQPFAPLLLLHPACPGGEPLPVPGGLLAEVGQESTRPFCPSHRKGAPWRTCSGRAAGQS